MVQGYMVSLCSLIFIAMECRIFSHTDKGILERDINNFIRNKEEVSISFSTSEKGYYFYYTALVYWK